MLTKTLSPSGTGTRPWPCLWVGLTLSTPGWSSFDFMQKPGEGETLMVTFKDVMG